MNNFTYCAPTEYIFGREAEMKVGTLAARAGMTRVLVVYGQGSVVRSGLLDRVLACLAEAGVTPVPFGGVQPNPIDTKVYEGIDLGRAEKIDGLIAVGGGSAIDTAKAIAAGILYDGDFWDFFTGKVGVTQALPVGVVLTIPAAGSEGSGNSVITGTKDNKKISMRTDRDLRPVFSCLNPELTYTLPPFQTACGIADMMAHIMERYFSPTKGVEVTDHVSEGLLKAIIEVAPRVMAEPDNYDARACIMWSGTLAHNGLCGTGCAEDWSSHAIEHEISALYPRVAHGAGLAVVFPAWLTYMAYHRPVKVAQYAERVFGISPDGKTERDIALEGIAALRDFFRSLGLPTTLGELGVSADEIPTLTANLHDTKGPLLGSYLPLSASETEKVYRLAL